MKDIMIQPKKGSSKGEEWCFSVLLEKNPLNLIDQYSSCMYV